MSLTPIEELLKRSVELEKHVNSFDDYEDVTDKFIETIKLLDPGQIAHAESFSLRSCMYSNELCEPRMDCTLNAENVLFHEEKLYYNLLPNFETLSTSEMCGLIDRLTTLEFCYYDGRTLQQTVYSSCFVSLYPKVSDSTIVKKYITAWLKSIILITELVYSSRCSTNDDFNSFLGEFNPFFYVQDLTPTNIVKSLNAVNNDLRKTLKEVSASPQPNIDEINALNALIDRFELRKLFLQILGSFSQKKITFEVTKKASETIFEIIEKIKKNVSSFPCPESLFEYDIYRRLTVPWQLKRFEFQPDREAYVTFTRILNEFVALSQFPESENMRTMLFQAIEFSSLNPHVVSRSVYRIYLNQHGDPVLSVNIVPQVRRTLKYKTEFFPKLLNIFRAFYQYLTLSRSRQFRSSLKLFRTLETIFDCANETDEESIKLLPSPFGSDCKPQVTKYFEFVTVELRFIALIRYFELGFEFDLINTEEMFYVLWYLDYLKSTYYNQLAVFSKRSSMETKWFKENPPHSKKKSTPIREKDVIKYVKKSQPRMNFLSGSRDLFHGFFKTLFGFARLGAIKQFPAFPLIDQIFSKSCTLPTPVFVRSSSKRPFTSTLFYERIQSIYACYPPDPVNYVHFAAHSSIEEIDPKLLFEKACESFAAAKTSLISYRDSLSTQNKLTVPNEDFPIPVETVTEMLKYCIMLQLSISKLLTMDVFDTTKLDGIDIDQIKSDIVVTLTKTESRRIVLPKLTFEKVTK